ncbi:MAG: hypothetical protein KDA58_04710 [Planctomycetaceae bacterium]|nr:hypothetical protein [Planctomycetaceae bacterium]
MAKRKAKPSSGDRVVMRDGATMPEFDSLPIGGWSGMVMEVQGRGAAQKIILEWDAATLDKMPAEYQAHCESQGLFHGYACIPLDDVELGED